MLPLLEPADPSVSKFSPETSWKQMSVILLERGYKPPKGGAGVEADYIFGRFCGRVREARDGFAGGVFAGIASAGRDDADAGAGTHSDGELVDGAVDGGVEEVEDVGFEAQEDGFGLGVA